MIDCLFDKTEFCNLPFSLIRCAFHFCSSPFCVVSTVYALWRVPELLPAFVLKGGEVSRFMLGGADLMFPGISIPTEGFPSFSSGEPWAVKVPGNPAAIAVSLWHLKVLSLNLDDYSI